MARTGLWPSLTALCAIAMAVGVTAMPTPPTPGRQATQHTEPAAGIPARQAVDPVVQPTPPPVQPAAAMPPAPASPLPSETTLRSDSGKRFHWLAPDTPDRQSDGPAPVAMHAPTPPPDWPAAADPGDWRTGPVFAIGFAFDTAEEPAEDSPIPAADGLDLAFTIDIGGSVPSLRNADYGALSFGNGPTATQQISEMDLSGTHPVARSNVAATAEGLYFENGTKVAGAFFNLDGGHTGRVSYRTPDIAGFRAAISGRQVTNTMAPDLALTYAGGVAGWDIAGGVGYRREPGRAGKDVVHGSASVLAPFGTNLTVAAGASLIDDDWGDDRHFLYAKLGQRIDWLDFGETRIAVDVYYGEPNETTDSLSIGGGLVHVIPALSTNLFLGARNYRLGVAGDDPDDVFTVYSGALIRF